jgi:hypothetical protein
VHGSLARRPRLTLLALLALAFTLLVGENARADPKPDTPRERAARAYDDGVRAFERAEYAAAAERFLEADAAVPSTDALANAVSAAQRSGDRALLERAAKRAILREPEDPELARTARRMLAEGAASSAAATRTTAPEATSATPSAGAGTSTTARSAAPATAPHDAASTRQRDAVDGDRTWPRAIFYAGAAGTAVLTGVTIWSGLDALSARNETTGRRTQNDSVVARARRTDVLLAGTIVLAAATAYVGFARIDWSAEREPVALGGLLSAEGAVVTAQGAW